MLNLPTLEARRQALKICYLYKLIHDLVFLPNCHIHYRKCQQDLALIPSKFHLHIVINVMLNGNGINYLQKFCHPLRTCYTYCTFLF